MIGTEQFELLVKKATIWVAAEENRICREGVPLTVSQLADAYAAGVKHPERVRLIQEQTVKLPADPTLADMAKKLGPTDNSTYARSHRYGIAMRADRWGDRELLVHELVHTHQYERLGGIEGFLRPYLMELLPPIGYPNGPLEREARRVAATICGTLNNPPLSPL